MQMIFHYQIGFFTQYNFISENSEFDVVSSWYTIFNKSVEYIIKVPQYHNSIVQKLALFSSICHPAVIYKKEKILQLGGYKNDGNLHVAQDYELWLRAKSKLKFYNIQEILLLYRIHSESNSNNLFKSERNIHYQIQEKYYKNLPLEFNINSNSEQIIMRGFREYFWGDIKTSRIYWRTLGVKLLITPKVFIAYILTFFNRDFVVKFNNYKIWLRMIFFIESIFDKNISDQKKYWEKAIE
ncbi:MAG: hypothetical protein IPK06_17055 [Ignavibacteriae bacterium]|nr:hypothetical protein [Ignavibacteriota bacterium]